MDRISAPANVWEPGDGGITGLAAAPKIDHDPKLSGKSPEHPLYTPDARTDSSQRQMPPENTSLPQASLNEFKAQGNPYAGYSQGGNGLYGLDTILAMTYGRGPGMNSNPRQNGTQQSPRSDVWQWGTFLQEQLKPVSIPDAQSWLNLRPALHQFPSQLRQTQVMFGRPRAYPPYNPQSGKSGYPASRTLPSMSRSLHAPGEVSDQAEWKLGVERQSGGVEKSEKKSEGVVKESQPVFKHPSQSWCNGESGFVEEKPIPAPRKPGAPRRKGNAVKSKPVVVEAVKKLEKEPEAEGKLVEEASEASEEEEVAINTDLRPLSSVARLGLKSGRRVTIRSKEWAGEVVWAKLGRDPWWPAQVLVEDDPFIPDDAESPRPGAVPVRFFGTYDFAWIESQRSVSPFDQGFGDKLNGTKCKEFRVGVNEALEFQHTGKSVQGFEDAMEDAPPEPKARSRVSKKGRPKAQGKRRLEMESPGSLPSSRQQTPCSKKTKVMRLLGLAPPEGSPFITNWAVNPNILQLAVDQCI